MPERHTAHKDIRTMTTTPTSAPEQDGAPAVPAIASDIARQGGDAQKFSMPRRLAYIGNF